MLSCIILCTLAVAVSLIPEVGTVARYMLQGAPTYLQPVITGQVLRACVCMRVKSAPLPSPQCVAVATYMQQEAQTCVCVYIHIYTYTYSQKYKTVKVANHFA